MERQIIEVQYPVINHQEAIANIGIVKHEIKNKMINIKEAFWTKNNSLFIIIDNKKEQSELIKGYYGVTIEKELVNTAIEKELIEKGYKVKQYDEKWYNIKWKKNKGE